MRIVASVLVLLALVSQAFAQTPLESATEVAASPWSPDGMGGTAAAAGETVGTAYAQAATGHFPSLPAPATPATPAAPAAPSPAAWDGPAPAPALGATVPASLSRATDLDAPRVSSPQFPDLPAPPSLTTERASEAIRAVAVADAGGLPDLTAPTLPLPAVLDTESGAKPPSPAKYGRAGWAGSDDVPGHATLSVGLADSGFARSPSESLPAGGPWKSPSTALTTSSVGSLPRAAPRLPTESALDVISLVGLLVLIPVLYHRIRHEGPLGHPARRALHQAVTEQPGCTIQGAARACGLNRGTALHHLRVLQFEGVVRMVAGKKEVHLFPQAGFDAAKQAQLALLARPRTRELAELIAAEPGLTRLDAAARMAVTRSTLDWHLGNLLECGLVEERLGRTSRTLHPQPSLLEVHREVHRAPVSGAMAASIAPSSNPSC